MRRKIKLFGWGDENISFDIDAHPGVTKYLKENFSIPKVSSELKVFSIDDLTIPPSRLDGKITDEFASFLGKENYSLEKLDRTVHAFGKSYKDLVRLRSMKIDIAPDIVLYPTCEAHIKSIFEICKKYEIAVVPFGGGTSVVGGVDAEGVGKRYTSSVDLTRLDKIIEFDEKSRLLTAESGIYGPDIEKFLNERGYTLGHFPQSFEFSTLGGWVSSRSSGQNSVFFGNMEKMVVSVRLITPTGVIETSKTPAKACGPEIKHMIIGSEGIWGIIYSCTIRVRPLPEEKDYFVALFRSFDDAAEVSRRVVQSGLQVAMIRASDASETDSILKLGSSGRGGLAKKLFKSTFKTIMDLKGLKIPGASMMVIGLEGKPSENRMKRKVFWKLISDIPYLNIGKSAGKKWLKDRFFLPYLRDNFLDHGLLVDTLETATTWSNLLNLYGVVKDAMLDACKKQDVTAYVYCHISHIYETGASLYFSIIAAQKGPSLIAQWQQIKDAASNAIVENGGVISHHHGIGIDHKRYLKLSDIEKSVWKSMKTVCDPDGIMNPGKLFLE